MSNSIIDRQREILANLDSTEGLPPIPSFEHGDGLGAPPAAPAQSVPGQEPPAAQAPGAAPAQPPAAPAPVAGSADETLKQANADLNRQVEEYKNLYNRQLGMVVPLQRKLAETERTNQDLQRQVEDLRRGQAGAPHPQSPQATPPASAGTEDPTLKEFTELYGDMIPGLKAFIQQAMGNVVQQVQPAIELSAETARQKVLTQHLAPLYVRYRNAGDIIRSSQFEAWVAQQPSYSQQAIIDKVTTPENYPVDQVISIFDEFTRATTAHTQPPPTQAQPAAPSPGEMAVDIRRVPTSSTPGGTPLPQPLTRERLTQINRALTVDRELYTAEQVAAFKAELSAGEASANAAGFGLAPRLDTLTR